MNSPPGQPEYRQRARQRQQLPKDRPQTPGGALEDRSRLGQAIQHLRRLRCDDPSTLSALVCSCEHCFYYSVRNLGRQGTAHTLAGGTGPSGRRSGRESCPRSRRSATWFAWRTAVPHGTGRHPNLRCRGSAATAREKDLAPARTPVACEAGCRSGTLGRPRTENSK
jgi:hypothetical protein